MVTDCFFDVAATQVFVGQGFTSLVTDVTHKNVILEKSPTQTKTRRTGKQKRLLLHFFIKSICHLSPVTDLLSKNENSR